MNKGVVIKFSEDQKYATSDKGYVIIKEISNLSNIPIQLIVPRNDLPSGSIICPILSRQNCINTIDLGIPQLAMHSIREMVSILDVYYGIKLLSQFYNSYLDINDNIDF